jgi:hypothetical protein
MSAPQTTRQTYHVNCGVDGLLPDKGVRKSVGRDRSWHELVDSHRPKRLMQASRQTSQVW